MSKNLLVVPLPGVEEHEVERAGELRDLLERVAGDHRDDVGEAGAADVVGGFLRARRVVLDRDERPPVSRRPRPIQMAL